jgi:K(+)-stimulated pyrophosphate-energized sodium pump
MVESLKDLPGIGVALGSGVIGLLFVIYLAIRILKKSQGTEKMREISEMVHEGAMAFLFREFSAIILFVAILGTVLYFLVAKKTAIAFVAGAFCSTLAGYFGMQIATRSNARTAQAATRSFNEALGIAFPGGAVMGISVAGLGLFGLSLVFLIFLHHAGLRYESLLDRVFEATQLIVGFSMGASSVALFARVGGGIYTKAADMGADLVGKVEAGIPEDDPRNPAVIADNVGDNVGDVCGMGADLFESYVGAIISAIVIAVSFQNIKGMILALLLPAWGIISSIIGIFFVRTTEGEDPQRALRKGMVASAYLLVIGAFFLATFWYGEFNVFLAILSGLGAGLVVGFTAEYYTSGKTVRNIARASSTGPATNILQGISSGMFSVAIPLVAIGVATIVAYKFADIFGIALSAVGMLSITGMTVAIDAYGPIADNACGIAQMAGMAPEVRGRTERLDAVGNTTAAIGKGFAIGSAALTALALFTAFAKTCGLSVYDEVTMTSELILNIMKPHVVAGLFIGGAVPFLFCAATMQAVGRSAFKIVEEVRRQFREIPGLMAGTARPDSARCVDITTRGALREMVIPGIAAVLLPLIMGTILGVEALGGFLAGSLVTGVPLAIFLANAGGAWDNAKKYIEEGNLGGKGSEVHKASIIGDTVGDPFKDTAGPSLNILLKLMAVVSLVFANTILSFHNWLVHLFL